MTLKMITLGCKVNQYESEAIVAMLAKSGVVRAENGVPADILILNSCTVTATSDQKVRQTLRREKRKNPDAVVVLTGCMAQAFPEKSAALEEADIVLGTANRARLLPHILTFLATRQRIIDITPHSEGEAFEHMEIQSFGDRTRAYVKIEDGCNRFCAYCIIPYARGRVRSKSLAALTHEIEALSQNGYGEVVLTGINLSCYGQDLDLHLCDAIEAAAAIPGIARVRLGSLEPEQLTAPVIARMAQVEKLCPQFHLSLQSGCDETLARMNRHYDTDTYREIVKNLRHSFDEPAITTDIMVGFPGETDAEFEKSLAFAAEIAFAQTHVFAYSRRPGTKADAMAGQLPNKVKDARSAQMLACTHVTRATYLKNQVGRTVQVLFEAVQNTGLYLGHTKGYVAVLAASGKDLKGQLHTVTITDADGTFCYGTLCP